MKIKELIGLSPTRVFNRKVHQSFDPQKRALRTQIATRDELVEIGKRLAAEHNAQVKRHTTSSLYRRLNANCFDIEHAYLSLSETARRKESITPGAEWLLDNYHVIEKQIADIRKHFPRGYDRSLPKLVNGEYALLPRVYHIALEFLTHTDSILDISLLNGLLEGYQTVSMLQIGEVWAIPIMVRFALLDNLRNLAVSMVRARDELRAAEGLVNEILGDETKPGTQILLNLAEKVMQRPDFLTLGAAHLIRRLRDRGRKASLTLQWLEERLREEGREPEEILKSEQYLQAADQISIGNTFTSLRGITYINWADWFESTCRVEHLLRLDPGGIYPRCDFTTRDSYRHEIEEIARASSIQENAVVDAALELARDHLARSQDPRHAHSSICHYLSPEGVEVLERKLGTVLPAPRVLRRALRMHAIPVYATLFLVFLGLLLSQAASHALNAGAPLWSILFALAFFLIPASDVANNLVQWIITHLTIPFALPKLDLDDGVPEDMRSVVVVHALFSDRDSVKKTIDGLHVRYLANEDPNLMFGVLADLADSDTQTKDGDQEIVDYAHALITQLRADYGHDRFFVLFRTRVWNGQESRWMAWERKRGKIEEFNRLLLGEEATTFVIASDLVSALRQCRYVITLDNDTQLPRGTARKLIAAIAHPLNAPRVDPQRRIVTKGYGIIQPRVGVSLTSANSSRFAKIFSGHSGLDPYTQTVSDVYQDLFSEGSFIGKGIYDVRAFEETLGHRVPENSLLSHDLFEGLFARVALASDIELFDDFPSKYHVHAKRQHRWIRGDWQLLPFLGASLPAKQGTRYSSPVSLLGRWKLLDNLRRSLVAPSVFALLVAGFTVLPGSPVFWVLLALLTVAFPVYANLAQALIIPPRGLSIESHLGSLGRNLFKMSVQALLTLAFLPHQAYLSLHAIGLTLWRLGISRKHLLQWETAYHSEKRLGHDLSTFLREMGLSLLLVLAAMCAIALFAPQNLLIASPFLIAWGASPWIASWLSEPKSFGAFELSDEQRHYLSEVGHDTWLYFNEFLNERNNYLIPDNIQLVPSPTVAERTSPTNVSLSMLATVSACDLGFISHARALTTIQKTFQSLKKLERFGGHFLNWYGTATLEALYPRYVSMVDSGNMVGHLITLSSALTDLRATPLLSRNAARHIEGGLKKLLSKLPEAHATRVREFLDSRHPPKDTSHRELAQYLTDLSRLRDHLLASAPDAFEQVFLDETADFLSLSRLVTWIDPLIALHREIQSDDQSSSSVKVSFLQIVKTIESEVCSLTNLRSLHDAISRLISSGNLIYPSAHALRAELMVLDSNLTELAGKEAFIRDEAEQIIDEMDFDFLFDNSKDLFVIGYNVDAARKDGSYYDLLASEARLGSLCAIALGQIPQRHWFSLGRGLTSVDGGKALLSWTGTMFEYLMPLLVMRNFPGTLLAETYEVCVKAQRAYASRFGVPWGISESGYSGVDFERTYQYKAFGVPGLGLKRGLEEDLVISPYSTCLALQVDPVASIDNLRALERDGIRGPYGFFEAVDYTTARLAAGEKCHVVQNFLAHHQGMSIAAINNVLNDGILQNRFHRDPRIQSAELLMHEKFPERLPSILPQQHAVTAFEEKAEEEEAVVVQTFTTPHTPTPRTHLISNGRYTVMTDNAGGGFSLVDREFSLTRWREDSVASDTGTFLYLRDLGSNALWSATFQPTLKEPTFYEAVFSPDKAEFKRRDYEIYSHLEITISPEDNLEIRRLTLANLSNEKREIEVTSFAEVSLAPTRADQSHPAFSKMFVQSEFLEDYDALLFTRRPRNPHEEKPYLLHQVTMRTVWDRTQYETSREAFIGRGRTVHNPLALSRSEPLSGNIGNVLDPAFSLRVNVELNPGESHVVTFLTGFSKNRDELLGYANRYRDSNQIQRAFEMAWSQSSIELRNERTFGKHGPTFQRLANALLIHNEKARAKPDVVARNRLGQSALWRFGISGDLPICLVRVTEPNQTKLVEECLQAHHYLRGRGFQFDLVIFNEHPGGYLQNAQEELEYMTRSSLSGALIDKKGGIFLRNMLQLSEEEKDLVQAVARVSLSGLRGSLAQQLKAEEGAVEWLPFDMRHQPVYSLSARDSGRETREFDNSIGGFIENGRAYSMEVTPEALPPTPWCNVIASPSFGTLISETGGGYTWSGNSRENRLTPWSNDPVIDPLGEVLYLRDTKSGAFWSPTPRPVLLESPVQVTHRFGESIFRSTIDGISTELSMTISTTDSVKWWGLSLSNLTPHPRTLEIFLYVDWVMGVSRADTSLHLVSSFDKATGMLCAQNHYNVDFAGRMLFLGATRPIESFTTSKVEFIGRNRNLASPLALELVGRSRKGMQKGLVKLSGKTGSCYDSCGVIKVLVNIEANGTEQLALFMGEAPSVELFRQNAPKMGSFRSFEADRERTKDYFSRAVSTVEVKTPDRSFDIMMNGWLVYQTLSCRLNGRTGFYQSGGAYGFRDQLQDSLSLLLSDPGMVRQQILLHASRQFPQGDVQHWWHPPTGKGVRTRISDDYLWLPLAVARYLEVTGDTSLLGEQVGYIEGPMLGEHEMEAYIVPHTHPHTSSIFEKCLLCLDRALGVGAHGLPFIGGGDWNDGMNEIGRLGKGESVWMGWFLATTLSRFIPILETRGDSGRVELYREKIELLRNALETHGWDGQWYRRAYFDDGSPVGSSSSVECKIDSLSQTWSIISGLGNPARARQALDQVYQQLVDSEHRVIKLLTPPFDSGPQEPGYIKGYLPGIRENGGQYTHAAAWVVIASAMMRDGAKPAELFATMNPILHTATRNGADKYKGEPYVLCGDVYSVTPHEGRAGWSWYTGSSGWLYQAGLEYILGLKVGSEGFSIDPCIPPTWNEYRVRWTRDRTTFDILVRNPDGGSHGIRALVVNGVPFDGNLLRFSDFTDERVTIEATLLGH